MFGVSGWKECRLHCDQQREDWKMHLSQWCSGWTYIPEHFTTPYNVQEGTCRVFTTTTLTPTPPTLDLLLEFTSNGWVEGMLSEYYAEEGDDEEEEEGEVKQVRTVVLTRPLQGKTSNHYTFDPSLSSLPFIEAVGTTSTFQYHVSYLYNIMNIIMYRCMHTVQYLLHMFSFTVYLLHLLYTVVRFFLTFFRILSYSNRENQEVVDIW